jgi:hypothetical protein
MEARRILCTVMLLIGSVFAEWGVEGSSGNVVFLVENDGSTYITTPPVTSIPDTLTGKVNGKVVGFSSSLLTSGSEPVSWFDIINKPTVFPPESHTQDISTINDLQNVLNDKAALIHTHGISDVDSLQTTLDGKEPAISTSTSDKFWNGLKQWVNITIGNVLGLNDTITNHRTAIASKLNISDTSSLARKNHGHSQSQITGLVDTVTAHRNAINNKQPLDTDLTTIAGLTHSNRSVLISDGSTWTRRALVAGDIPYLPAEKITSGTLDNARLSFDPSSFAKLSLGTVRASGGFATSLETGRDVFASGLYTYRFMVDALNKPAGISLGSVLTWGLGVAGAGQLAVGWTAGDHNKLVFRSLRDTQNDWWDWKEIYHTGNFDPSTKSDTDHTHTPSAIGAEPAISGTAYKVLSIQSDGSGVKTGCLSDLGNYAAIDNAEHFAIIHSTDQAAISLQSQSGNRFWISSAPNVLNIGSAGGSAPENGQLQIYHNSRVVIPSLPLLVGKATATTGNPYKIEVEGNALVNGTLKANDFGDDWVDYSSSIQFTGFNEIGLTKKVYYKKEGKKITIVFYFDGTCNSYYFSLNHTTIGNIKSEHMIADKSLYTGILHYNGYINGFASTIVESLDGEIRIRAITNDGIRFPEFSSGQPLTIRGSFTYYTD